MILTRTTSTTISTTTSIEVFGRSWWGGRYFQDSYELVLDARAPLSLDRA